MEQPQGKVFKGLETTTSGISWILYSLVSHPVHQQRCQKRSRGSWGMAPPSHGECPGDRRILSHLGRENPGCPVLPALRWSSFQGPSGPDALYHMCIILPAPLGLWRDRGAMFLQSCLPWQHHDPGRGKQGRKHPEKGLHGPYRELSTGPVCPKSQSV